MNISRFKEIIKEREKISKETQDNWDYGIEKCWTELIKLVSDNVDESINFILNDCTKEEFSWLSEVIEDIIENTKSKNLLEAYKSVANKYADESKKYHVFEKIQDAESLLEEDK